MRCSNRQSRAQLVRYYQTFCQVYVDTRHVPRCLKLFCLATAKLRPCRGDAVQLLESVGKGEPLSDPCRTITRLLYAIITLPIMVYGAKSSSIGHTCEAALIGGERWIRCKYDYRETAVLPNCPSGWILHHTKEAAK